MTCEPVCLCVCMLLTPRYPSTHSSSHFKHPATLALHYIVFCYVLLTFCARVKCVNPGNPISLLRARSNWDPICSGASNRTDFIWRHFVLIARQIREIIWTKRANVGVNKYWRGVNQRCVNPVYPLSSGNDISFCAFCLLFPLRTYIRTCSHLSNLASCVKPHLL